MARRKGAAMQLKIGTMRMGRRTLLVLSDANGNALPGQTDLHFEQPYQGQQRVTITFTIDDDAVVFDPTFTVRANEAPND